MIKTNSSRGEIILYQTEDGLAKIEVELQGETVWLTQEQMARLFQRDISVISRHIRNVFGERELDKKSNLQKMQLPNSDKPTNLYSLDVIISVGYRVKSLRGTQFRIWANSILKEYIQKGFAMNDALLKNEGGGNYFNELLARIRDIRTSEKVFYRKVLEIYATSIDYDPSAESSRLFFQTVQNKMHFAAHGNTAAELIYYRSDGDSPFSGMTAWHGDRPKESDAIIAKNYLSSDEIDTLNRIVTLYLEFAELQAKERIPMYMKDWLERLDDFLQVSRKGLLNHAGKISHEVAEKKALTEFAKYKTLTAGELSAVEKHFLESIDAKQK
ncbi:virulence RhuM family protein [Deferribacterales bacterium RsTz2092]|nr:toxin Fic [Deferribacterales bacterium]